ncbi:MULTISPECIES: GreA/GreB family elongation factor [Pseudomonas]|uniref:Transcription elongation factor GreAB n=1 Tax=Pseudomonas quercus TaxID=2722792 RepID=A0ABX0YDP7_9PSED|nr:MULTISPECIES: GreA/GreB family elongation factor [Pseudomonas]MBF7142983.1 GreA/GreB family elongation factor [Pseudomonas sp. LY10J]NJP01531.1 transcription elongation factor GreAB [Pseudomonas quercus]
MSRAFVNEDNAAAQASQPVERSISLHPNYVTESGMVQLRARADELRALHLEQSALGDRADHQALADLERDMRYYHQRLSTAKVVPPVRETEKVQIGSWVSYADERDVHRQVCLVGEDQADVGVGLVNWASPLGRALMGARVGDEVLWHRPAGDHTLEVLAISATPD